MFASSASSGLTAAMKARYPSWVPTKAITLKLARSPSLAELLIPSTSTATISADLAATNSVNPLAAGLGLTPANSSLSSPLSVVSSLVACLRLQVQIANTTKSARQPTTITKAVHSDHVRDSVDVCSSLVSDKLEISTNCSDSKNIRTYVSSSKGLVSQMRQALAFLHLAGELVLKAAKTSLSLNVTKHTYDAWARITAASVTKRSSRLASELVDSTPTSVRTSSGWAWSSQSTR